MNKRLTVPDILSKKGKDKIVMLTCYTAQMAKILDNHVDILLVGDSLGMTIYGHQNTLSVSLRMMIDHGLCVVNNSNKALVVIDMPFGTYEADKVKAFETAAELISKTKATAIKIEGLIENENTSLDNLDSELSYQISKLVRREFKSSFSKRPIIDIHINRV